MHNFVTPRATDSTDHWIDQINVAVELPTGPPGTDGTTWITGEGEPNFAPEEHTLYLDVDTGVIYEWNGEEWIPIASIKYDHNHGDIYLRIMAKEPQTVFGQVTFTGPVLLPDPTPTPSGSDDTPTIQSRTDPETDPQSYNPIEAANKGWVNSFFQSFNPDRMLGTQNGAESALTPVNDVTGLNDWDLAKLQGIYHQVGGGGLPPGVEATATTIGIVMAGELNQCSQMIFSLGSGPTGGKTFTRSFNGTTWAPWQMLGYHVSDGTPTPADLMPAGALWIEY